MRWLVKRLAIVCLALSVLCSAAIVLGRLDHTPSKLQTVGIDVCDGDPCFEGVKPGADWTQIEKLFSNAVMKGSYLHVPSNRNEMRIGIIPSRDGKSVEVISIDMQTEYGEARPICAEDIIAQYGMPCRVYMEYGESYPGNMVAIYPMMTVRFNLQTKNPDDSYDYRLRMDSPIWDFTILANSDPGSICKGMISRQLGPWRGFTSADRYLTRNLDDLAVYQRTSGKH